MFDVILYFAGPLSLWSGKPHPREVIARRQARWLWLAHVRAQSVLVAVDSGRCAYVVMKDGKIIHHDYARDKECNPLPGEADLVNDLPEILKRNNDALETRIAEKIKRGHR